MTLILVLIDLILSITGLSRSWLRPTKMNPLGLAAAREIAVSAPSEFALAPVMRTEYELISGETTNN